MAHGDFKDLTGRTVSDRILHDKPLSIAKNLKYDGCQPWIISTVYNFFDKKASGSDIKNENISKKELGEKLNKPIIRKLFKKIINY